MLPYLGSGDLQVGPAHCLAHLLRLLLNPQKWRTPRGRALPLTCPNLPAASGLPRFLSPLCAPVQEPGPLQGGWAGTVPEAHPHGLRGNLASLHYSLHPHPAVPHPKPDGAPPPTTHWSRERHINWLGWKEAGEMPTSRLAQALSQARKEDPNAPNQSSFKDRECGPVWSTFLKHAAFSTCQGSERSSSLPHERSRALTPPALQCGLWVPTASAGLQPERGGSITPDPGRGSL